ncbi:conserved protein of unknown function [Bradyrhizobium sp. ORS 285]|uniref:hypothetical protein n=1 Tax=Bradyrhizobium sp. ORS 285 TaxID=115808 RepID=UPI0002409FFF|nr:hypothetical protein [Bradyrhizobium sp. ORS 285]CCD86384.1 conserved hypothetical protein [Bradyrhizobium sp. ORS 285]SMX61149.1 conserved protein of unknown function [Bradyrhizobium sp. ORS 285]
MSLRRKILYFAGAVVVAAAIGITTTVITVETVCSADVPTPVVTSQFGITDPGYARSQGDSFLTFPEWYIVHAYSDLAGVTGQKSESDFHYLSSIAGFWRSLCRATRQADGSGPATSDQKLTNYIIGFSFTAEMALQGGYEKTVGALTEETTDGVKTAEDAFNLALLKDYAAFLYQTPWYRYPFWAKLEQFWRDTPFVPSLRSVERRLSLSLQYAGRAAYAAVIGYAAGYDPAILTIQSVVTGLPAADLAAIPGVKVIREVTDAKGVRGVLVQTERYARFDAFVKELGRHPGAALAEVAGNHRILVTIVVPPGDGRLAAFEGLPIFSVPIQSRPGARRIGVDVPIRSLVQDITRFEAAGYDFEHAYDY